MIGERALQYASQLEAHLDEDGGFNAGNVRDLIGFVNELVAEVERLGRMDQENRFRMGVLAKELGVGA